MYTLRPTEETVQENSFLLFRPSGPHSVLRCLILDFSYTGRSAPCKADSVYMHLHYIVNLQPVRVSIRPSAWNNSAPTGRILMKFDTGVFS
jgi:hypothetical protein